MQRSLKISLRLLLGAALLICALALLAARADATEPETPPAAEAPPAPTEEVSPDPADLAPPAQEPTEPQPQTTPPAGAGGPDGEGTAAAGGPAVVNDQQAGVSTGGTAVANTGANGAAAGSAASPAPTGPDADPATVNSDATVGTGNASGVGTTGTTGIDQQAVAQATDQGAVDIVQIALVVNVGVSYANSGANGAVAAGSGGVDGTSAGTGIGTGDAGATGNRADTTVTQAARIVGGDDSTQVATVINIGIGIGNTGLNVALAGIDVSGLPNGTQIIFLGNGSNTAGVASGDADSIGNRSGTQISQQATGTASGTAILIIDQRAVVVNFGISFANTGGNLAFAGGQLPPEVMAQLQAVLSLLAPLLAQFQYGTSPAGTGSAAITTGDASAVGNDSRTRITQVIDGAVSGDETARASQQAIVANFGLALANSGFNLALAGGGYGTGDAAALASINGELVRFFSLLSDLSWLTSDNPFAGFARTIALNGMTLELGGDISGVEFLLGWDDALFPDGGPVPGGVRVRQISAVLDLGFVIANTGENVAVAVVSGREATGPELAAANGVASAVLDAAARIGTGDAFAVGNDVVVRICQTFNVDGSVCAPDDDDEEEPEEPGGGGEEEPEEPGGGVTIEPGGPLAPPQLAGPPSDIAPVLPVTGGDARSTVATALGMLALGGLFARRRRPLRRTAR